MKTIIIFLIFVSNIIAQPQPIVNVSSNPSEGKLFISNFFFDASIANTPYLMIVNNDGSIYWSRQLRENSAGLDFKKQSNGTYTYFEWYPRPSGQVWGKFYQLDNNFNLIDSFECGNGFPTDGHELIIRENGNALIMSYDSIRLDMRAYHPQGNPNALVFGTTIQELDINKNVIFQWRGFDYYNIADMLHRDFTLPTIDAFHGNSIEVDSDGNFIVSMRHLCEITKINRNTGAIMWRLGGNNNQFRFINETNTTTDTNHYFCSQHDARKLPNGNYTLYDNGNTHYPIPFSRAVEYTLNTTNMTATLAWEFRHSPRVSAGAMGNFQRLPNGNSIIGWGSSSQPMLTEVTPTGQTVLEMSFPEFGMYSYRAFKFELGALPMVINIQLAPEGLFNPMTDELNMRDTVRAYLHSSFSPFNVIDSAIALIDTVSGFGRFEFHNTESGRYYIVVKHRNSIETWSKSPGELLIAQTVNEYSFVTGASQAYGSNLKNINGTFVLYSGDVNSDGIIDAGDGAIVDNAAREFKQGYVREDLTGNNFVDGSDLIIVENNSLNVIMVQRP